MKSVHFSIHSAPIFSFNPNNLTSSSSSSSPIALLRPCKFSSLSLRSTSKPSRLITLCAPNSAKATSSRSESAAPVPSNEAFIQALNDTSESQWTVEVGNPSVPSPSVARLSLSDQAFFLLAFIACTTSVAFTSLVIAAVPTLCAMGKAAISLSKLADTAREELPSTMAAVRLSGMEISDLTLELNDLSQEIADGVTKSTQAVQAAEAGIRQIGTLAHQRTMSMIQERANLPIISLQPAVVGAAKKTSHVVGQATRNLINIISRRDDSENEEDAGTDREYGPTLIIVIEMPRNKEVSSEDTMVSEEDPELPMQRLYKVLKLSSVKGVRKKFLKLIFSNVRSLDYLFKLVRLAVKR